MSETRVLAVMTRSSSQDEAEPKAEALKHSRNGPGPVGPGAQLASAHSSTLQCVRPAQCSLYASLIYYATLTLI